MNQVKRKQNKDSDNIKVVVVKNPLVPSEGREISSVRYSGQDLKDIISQFAADFECVIIFHNQKKLPACSKNNYSGILNPGDEILIIPAVYDPVSGILAASTFLFETFMAYNTLGYILWTGVIIPGAIAFGMSYLIKAIGGDPDKADALPSPTHTWSPVTTQVQGLVIPRNYGTNKLYGNIIAVWTQPDGETETMYMLIALGDGPVEGIVTDCIGLTSVKLNDQDIASFPGVSVRERKGLIGQTPIYDSLKIQYDINRQIFNSEGPYIWTTPDNDFDSLEIAVMYQGMYIRQSGKISAIAVIVWIEISEHDEDTWSTLAYEYFYCANMTVHFKNYLNTGTYSGGAPVTVTKGKRYDIRVTMDTADMDVSRAKNGLYFHSVREVINSGFSYPCTALLAVEALATDQLSGSMKVSCLQQGRICNVYDGAEWALQWTNNPAWVIFDLLTCPVISGGEEPYEYYFEGIGDSDDFAFWSGYNIQSGFSFTPQISHTINRMRLILAKYDISYYTLPVGTLTINIYAADASHFPTGAVLCTAVINVEDIPNTGSKYGLDGYICSLFDFGDGAALTAETEYFAEFVLSNSDNGIRIIGSYNAGYTRGQFALYYNEEWLAEPGFDVYFTEYEFTPYAIERYDAYNPSRLTAYLSEWLEAAAYYTEQGIEFNGCFDTEINIWDAVQKVCFVGRCEILRIGLNYTILVSKPYAGPAVQLFSAANIKPDTFEKNYIDTSEAAGELEINYNDSDLDYDMTPLSLYDSQLGNSTKKMSIDGFGITNANQAWKMLYYSLAKNRLLLYEITFEVDVDAIACRKGDVVSVRPPWRSGGRITSCPSNNQVVVDANLADTGTDTIVIRVHDPDTGSDSIETHTVAAVDGKLVTIDDTWTINPKKGDIYSFGPSTETSLLFIVTGKEEASELTHKIHVMPYDADIWAGDALEPDIVQTTAIVSQSTGSGRTSPPTSGSIADAIIDPSATQQISDTPDLYNIEWTNNSPSAGYIKWAAKDSEEDILITIGEDTYEVSASNTNKKYVYFDINVSTTAFQKTDVQADAIGVDKYIICINNGGTAYPYSPNKIINTALIKGGASGTLVMDDGTTEKLTLVYANGILMSVTVEATTSSALIDWTAA